MFQGKKVLVLGLAKSGKAAIRLLQKNRASITLNVNETIDKIEDYQAYIDAGIEVIAGGHPAEVFERDFDFVVKNPGINYRKFFILRLQERGIPIYTEIELAYQLAKPQKYLAITGTNGKTTTVSLITDILKAQYQNVHLGGNIGTPLCDIVMDYHLQEEEGHYIVLEMSNFQLLDIATFSPTISTVINLTPDHLDYMDTLDAYYASKMNIYKKQTQGCFILNIDDPVIKDYTTRYPIRCAIVTMSLVEQADCYIENEYIKYKGEEIIAIKDIKVVGKHNLQNIMTAICMCKACSVETKVLNAVIRSFIGVEHRVEFVREIQGAKVYNDSKATNTDATIIALQAFETPVTLLMGGFDKGLDVSSIASHRDKIGKLITFGAAGERFLQEMHVANSVYVTNLQEATRKALQEAQAGEVIVLSPSTSSFDEFKSFEERGNVFKNIVNQFGR